MRVTFQELSLWAPKVRLRKAWWAPAPITRKVQLGVTLLEYFGYMLAVFWLVYVKKHDSRMQRARQGSLIRLFLKRVPCMDPSTKGVNTNVFSRLVSPLFQNLKRQCQSPAEFISRTSNIEAFGQVTARQIAFALFTLLRLKILGNSFDNAVCVFTVATNPSWVVLVFGFTNFLISATRSGVCYRV